MEKNTPTEKHKLDYHVQTEYNRWGGALNIELGKPVKLPNLKRTILNTSR